MKHKLAFKVAQILMAAELKAKKPPIAEMMRNEAYQRTMSDEYSWVRKPRPRESISEEARRNWELLRERT